MKKVTIVGVGALGSHVALFLRNEAELKLIDFDRVEQKNTLSQFYGKPGLGKNKALALKDLLSFLFGVKAEGIPHKYTEDNRWALLKGAELIIDCLDNGASRRLVQASSSGIPVLHGALAADGAFGRVIWDEDFIVDEGAAGAPTCEGGEHLPFIALVAAHMAQAAKIFLTRDKRVGYQLHPGGTTIV